jgi:hypothetical protein
VLDVPSTRTVLRAAAGVLLLALVATASVSDTRAVAPDEASSAVAAQRAIRVVDARGRARLEAALAEGWRVESTQADPAGTVYLLVWPDEAGPTETP